MQKAAIAEHILSLAAPPERAHSTVGDLMEESESRGSMWFWINLLQTISRQLLSDFIEFPLSMLRLAAWGWLAPIALAGPIIMLSYWVLDPIAWRLGYACGGSQCWPVIDWKNPWINRSTEILVTLIAGWMVARRSKGRELSAALAVILLGQATHSVAMYLSALQMRRMGQPWPIDSPLVSMGLYPLVLLAGALGARHRSLSTLTAPVLEHPDPNA